MDINFRLSALNKFLEDEKIIASVQSHMDMDIYGFSSISLSKPHTISWTRSMQIDWSKIDSSVVICPLDSELPLESDIQFIPVENPRLAFIKILRHFAKKPSKTGIENTVVIGEDCRISEDAYIGHHTSIGDNVSIGAGTEIYSNVAIHDNVEIGKDCVINSGAVVGTDGFGYEKDGEVWVKFPHIGGVTIGDNVEIGSNTCIDRGTLANTVIEDNVKIDNLCHIAHNVRLKENSVIIACSMVGGSTTVGKGSWVAPCSALIDGIEIGDDATVGLGAVVIKDVAGGDTVVGVPAKKIEKE